MFHEYIIKFILILMRVCSHFHIAVIVVPTTQSLNIVLLLSVKVSCVRNGVTNEQINISLTMNLMTSCRQKHEMFKMYSIQSCRLKKNNVHELALNFLHYVYVDLYFLFGITLVAKPLRRPSFELNTPVVETTFAVGTVNHLSIGWTVAVWTVQCVFI